MVFLLMCMGLYFLCGVLGAGANSADNAAKERFVNLFIVRYAEMTGKILTRSLAEEAIRITAKIEGLGQPRDCGREAEYRDPMDKIKQLCEAAERHAGTNYR